MLPYMHPYICSVYRPPVYCKTALGHWVIKASPLLALSARMENTVLRHNVPAIRSERHVLSYRADQPELPDSRQLTMENTRAVVFDVGSDSIRAGHAGEAGPTYTTPTLVNMTQHNSTTTTHHPASGFVGSDASADDAPTVSPVRNGVITHWEAMERLWERAFCQLNVPSEKHAVLLSDPPLGPRTQREKLAEVMFETFCVPGLHVENQSVLSVYSSGRTSGLVVGSGTGCTYATPVHEGVYLPSATCCADYAGNSLDLHLRTLLQESGREIPEDRPVVTDIKKKCYVSADIHTENLKIHHPMDYVLPDGRKIKLGHERFLVPEALFQPSGMGSREPGLATLVMNCLNMCEVEAFSC